MNSSSSSHFSRSLLLFLLKNHTADISGIHIHVHANTADRYIVKIYGIGAEVIQVNWRMCTAVVEDTVRTLCGFTARQPWNLPTICVSLIDAKHISFIDTWTMNWRCFVCCFGVSCLRVGRNSVSQQRLIIVRLATGWRTRLSVAP